MADETRVSDLVPRPDPSALTDVAIAQAKDDLRRELTALRELLETLIAGVRQELAGTWNLHTSDIDQLRAEIRAIREVIFDKFSERDLRFAQGGAAAEKALDNALRTARELVDTKADGAQAAADKFQEAIVRQISDSNRATSEGLARLATQLTELDKRVGRAEGKQTGTQAAHSDLRLNLGVMIAAVAMVVTLIVGVLLYIKK